MNVVNTSLLPRILLLLLSGMVINIAVALGCAMWSTFPRTGQEVVPGAGAWPREVSPRWPRDNVLLSTEKAFGLTSIKSWAVVQRRKDPGATLTRYLDVLRVQAKPASDRPQRIEATTDLLRSIQANGGERLDERVNKVTTFLRAEATDLDEATRNEIKQLILSLTDRNTNFSLYVREAGWPWRALEAEALSDKSLEPRGRHAIQLPRSRAGILLAQTGRWLPLNPMPLGFVLNTFFFAGLLGLIALSCSMTRNVLRTNARCCPTCGSGIGVESTCDECGQDLSKFWGK